MSLCTICRGNHHAASCKHRSRSTGRDTAPTAPPSLSLTPELLDDMAYRAKENRQFTRVELEELIAAARVALGTRSSGAFARLQEEMRRRT